MKLVQEHAYGEGLRRPSSTPQETNSASKSRRSSMLSRVGSHQVSSELWAHHISDACKDLPHCPGPAAPKGAHVNLTDQAAFPRCMHAEPSSRSAPHAGQQAVHENSMVTGAFVYASKITFCMLMKKEKKNHYIFSSQVRADQMPGPPTGGPADVYTLSTHAS